MMKWMEQHKQLGPLILRVFFGAAFLVAGLDKVLSFDMMSGMFKSLFGNSLGTPMLVLAIVLELAGGAMLLLNWHANCAALVLSGLIAVAFVTTFKLGTAPNVIGTLREMMVMNTGGGNTAVNLAYLAGLLSLAFNGCETCRKR
ncbi:DoxX family protein [Candidatus Woesearchaeota archaeon]|nr:DoxX family protein [Candidatus Woesearchaeota archaeon]